MSVQFNPGVKTNAVSESRTAYVKFAKTDFARSASTLESLHGDTGATNEKHWYSCFTNMFHKVGNFFSSMFQSIKGYFCKTSSGEVEPKTTLERMQDVSAALDDPKADKNAVLAALSKVPEEHRNEMFNAVYKAKGPAGNVSDKAVEGVYYGEEQVNNNPKDTVVANAIKGYVVRQEKIIPLQEFNDLVGDTKVSADVILDKFNALPTEAADKNLKDELGYTIWEAKAKNTPSHDAPNFVIEFLKKSPHDAAVKKAVADTIARM